MKNITTTLTLLVLPLFSSAQTLFFHPTSFDLPYDQEWKAVYVTESFVSDEQTISFDHFLVVDNLNYDSGVYIFNHYVEGELVESFTYNVATQSIFPEETRITTTAVEF